MPIAKLSDAAVRKYRKVGRHNDGGGLWLQISKWGGKSWIFQFTLNGRRRQHGLGGYPDVSLIDAREKAAALRKQVGARIDPIVHKKVDDKRSRRFRDVAAEYISKQSYGWRNRKHAQQWGNTLAEYAFPHIGDMAVSEITKADVLRVLQPIWLEKTETADRVRNRIEQVLSYAKSHGMRDGDNAAAWRDNLKHDLPSPTKLKRRRRQPAIHYSQLPTFMNELRANDSVSARALEFTILTAARTTAVIGAVWTELDLVARQWTVSPERVGVKLDLNADPKVVPLSDDVMKILKALPREEGNPHVFIGAKRGCGLSDMAMLELLRGMVGKGTATVHGFRSSFRDWAAEQTNYPAEVAEQALWHSISDQTVAAYLRGSLLEKRRRLMRDWAKFCEQPPASNNAKIIPLREAGRG